VKAQKTIPLKNIPVNFPLCLAPMVGLSHVATRMVLREYMPENATTIWPTEMLNSKRLPFEDLSKTPEALRDQSETQLVPQILGNEEVSIQASVAKLTEWGAEGIDINMGCPVQKALRHNYGVALMGDADYAKEVVKMTVKHSKVPVSVKLRAGNQGDFEYLKRFVEGLVDGGASWVTLHPRTAEQKRRGRADWAQIKKLKQSCDIPVIGNGDIQTDSDVFAMLNETDCDLVMAGRALIAKPWMLWQVGEALGFENPKGRTGKAPRSSEEQGAEYGRMILRLISYMRIYFSEELALRKLRFYIRTTSVWLPFGQTLVSLSTKGKTLNEVESAMVQFFSSSVEMSERTELRQ
jgi:tRNA-dihydrouridine synthase B